MRVKLLLVAVIAACGGGTPPTEKPDPELATPHTPTEVVEAAKGAVEQYRQAYEVRSLESLTPLYSHGLDVAVIHQGRGYHGWSAVEKYLRELIGKAAEIHLTITEVNVASLGPGGAGVTAHLVREISDGVTKIEEEGTLTLTLRLAKDRWVIVTEHFSYRPIQ